VLCTGRANTSELGEQLFHGQIGWSNFSQLTSEDEAEEGSGTLAANLESCAVIIDVGERKYLRPMREARCQAMLKLSASLVLWDFMSEGSLEIPQEEVLPAADVCR